MDVGFDSTICTQLVIAFLINSSYCESCVNLSDPTIHEALTISWFQQNCAHQLSPAPVLLPPSTSTHIFPTSGFSPAIKNLCATIGEMSIVGPEVSL
jgi:hypothetical protein